jgi:hypothetical protein
LYIFGKRDVYLNHPDQKYLLHESGKPLNVLMAAFGGNHAIVVDTDKRVYTFGSNSDGQLGREVESCPNCPDKVPRLLQTKNYTQIQFVAASVGDCHSLLLDIEGFVYSFGCNTEGQVGSGSGSHNHTFPVRINRGDIANKNIVAISAGYEFSLALDIDGNVYSCGGNYAGQLGRSGQSSLFLRVLGLLKNKKIKAINSGTHHAFAVDEDGNLFGWGDNTYSQLGIANDGPDKMQFRSPVHITKGIKNKRVVQVASGAFFSLILDSEGHVYATGYNNVGQLGIPNVSSINSFTLVPFSSKIKIVRIIAGDSHTLVLDEKGNLYAWGFNSYSQVIPENNSKKIVFEPTRISVDHVRSQNDFFFAGGHTSGVLVYPQNEHDEL